MAKRGSGGGSLRPGHKAPDSGQYHSSKTGGEVTSEQGERLPPGPKGTRYTLVDRTKHGKR
jgi:hypothetical protein